VAVRPLARGRLAAGRCPRPGVRPARARVDARSAGLWYSPPTTPPRTPAMMTVDTSRPTSCRPPACSGDRRPVCRVAMTTTRRLARRQPRTAARPCGKPATHDADGGGRTSHPSARSVAISGSGFWPRASGPESGPLLCPRGRRPARPEAGARIRTSACSRGLRLRPVRPASVDLHRWSRPP